MQCNNNVTEWVDIMDFTEIAKMATKENKLMKECLKEL